MHLSTDAGAERLMAAWMTLFELIQRAFFARPRFSLLVLGIFAGTGIVLVAFGAYGVPWAGRSSRAFLDILGERR